LEFQRRFDAIGVRFQLPENGFRSPPGQARFFIQDMKDVKEGVFLLLVYTNVVIFFFSAASGYFLAGKTLSPIERSLEEQKRFVADASHELKTPLTSLQTSIEVALRDKNLKLKCAKETLKESLIEVENMGKLANDLLNLAKYQTANNSFSLETVKLRDVADKAKKTLNPIANKKDVKMHWDIAKIKLKANKTSLEKLLTILVDNAIKYTPQNGKVVITAKTRGKKLVLKVSDNGIGISDEDIDHIFDRFYRVEQSRSKESYSGFGLGLAVAKKIVELHKGRIKVKSKLGKGTSFIVYLPV
jgi:signal transduction histidine kinase